MRSLRTALLLLVLGCAWLKPFDAAAEVQEEAPLAIAEEGKTVFTGSLAELGPYLEQLVKSGIINEKDANSLLDQATAGGGDPEIQIAPGFRQVGWTCVFVAYQFKIILRWRFFPFPGFYPVLSMIPLFNCSPLLIGPDDGLGLP